MSKFLTGEELFKSVYDIIWDAENTLLIVSPYIKLDDYFKELFDHHLHKHKLHLLLVFGKNERNVKKSMSEMDFNYFKKFPNVSIVYVPNLHAKYYGNEKKGVISSINLYDYSFKNNIEFGVFSEQSIFNRFSSSADNDAWNECMELAEDNETVFIRRPVYKTKKFLLTSGIEYMRSETLYDATADFYGVKRVHSDSGNRLYDFKEQLEVDSDSLLRPERNNTESSSSPKKPLKKVNTTPPTSLNKKSKIGYCIRTGEEIDFNPERPMSLKAFKKWNQFQDVNYGEAYCHFSGEQSFGETSFAKPIMRKYWQKAQN